VGDRESKENGQGTGGKRGKNEMMGKEGARVCTPKVNVK